MIVMHSHRARRAAILAVLVPGLFALGTATAMAHVAHERMRQGNWQLDMARDRFSGALACQLRSRDNRMIYRSGGVGFRFYRVPRVTEAVYRIDGGDARAARDDLPRLIVLGTPIDHGSMTDPTDGIVWVPYEHLTQARSIAIAPQRGGSPRVFRLGGLVALHDIAVTRGCAPESRFVDK